MSDTTSKKDDDQNAAANVARAKIETLYRNEPDAKEEIVEAAEAGPKRTKHQEFMYKLSTSGKSLAQIQTEWHEYYQSLPDREKHQVWQEFYETHNKKPDTKKTVEQEPPNITRSVGKEHGPQASHKPRTVSDLKKHINRQSGNGKLSKRQHLKSLLFGLGMGSLVVVVLLFGFFNERFVAPFITPSRSVSSTPIIIDPDSTQVGPEPKVIIPKINVEIPVVYGVDSISEEEIQAALEGGVVHYPTTPKPGEKGNTAIVGHSSNNLFNSGKYKFAFVLLSRLEKGDTFYLNYKGTRYAYKIYEKKIVSPDDVSVLGPNNKTATATLITCDPPGTSLNRLIVVGEQITPDPSDNKKSSAKDATTGDQTVPGNAPSLWSRILEWF